MNSKIKIITKKPIISLVIIAALIIVGIKFKGKSSTDPLFRTSPVVRGDLVATITATGTVEPEELVDVGAQVAGQVISFGKDKNGKTIDYGSEVDVNTILAQIDPAVYNSDVTQATASLEQAKTGVIRAEADLGQMKAKLVQAQLDWQRAQKLGPSEAIAKTTYDSYQAAYEVAKANLNVGESAIEQAKAQVLSAQAVLDKAKRNLGYCTIVSPVKGVIIDRRVNIGQTVVSSLNAPSLFLIAKDLKQMQVWVAVSEADIGNIHPGQRVTFNIDAYPGQTFTGEVGKVRLNATMTQNVVTYTVEIITDNSSGKLIPYLTATAHFEVSRRDDVLQVPNSALRWTPQTQQILPAERAAYMEKSTARNSRNAPKEGSDKPQKTARFGTVWLQDGSYVKPIKVKTGIRDDYNTEIEPVEPNSINEDTPVITGDQIVQTNSTGTTNPFAPQLRRGR